jgi:type IV pilus assembly protein PilF
MKTIPKTIMLLLVAACAADPAREGPGADTRTQIGEVSEPRNRARIHTELAAAYFERGNMAVALEELRVAAGADSTYAPAYSLFGLVYMELRERDLAAKNFERALSLAPNDGEINHNYGLFLCQTERAPDSIKYFMQAVKNPLYATPSRSYSAAGLCTLRASNTKEAEQFFERALRLEPDEPSSLLHLGQIRYKQGRMDDARRLVSRYNKLGEPNSESLWLALRIERRLGDKSAESGYAGQLRRRFSGTPEFQSLQKGLFE